jgi:hypothetical protein
MKVWIANAVCGQTFYPQKKAPLWPKSLFSLIVIDTGKMNDYF